MSLASKLGETALELLPGLMSAILSGKGDVAALHARRMAEAEAARKVYRVPLRKRNPAVTVKRGRER